MTQQQQKRVASNASQWLRFLVVACCWLAFQVSLFTSLEHPIHQKRVSFLPKATLFPVSGHHPNGSETGSSGLTPPQTTDHQNVSIPGEQKLLLPQNKN